ncbi:MAG: class I SAM-dependent methyltransferase [Anaerolineales bacterium]
MRRSLKFIPWILPFLGILLGYGYAYVFFHGLLETWQFVGKPDENIARIIGIRERTFNLQPSTSLATCQMFIKLLQSYWPRKMIPRWSHMKIIAESFAGVATLGTRLVEMYSPEEKRLFEDQFALKLLPFGWRVFFRLAYLPGLRSLLLSLRERRMPGTLGAILCRTRYIDDVLRKSLQEGLDQLVILGAGFDTRAYRVAGMDRVRVFEVDLPGTCRLKQIRLKKVLGVVPDNVTLVGMDFEKQKLEDVLKAAGFQTGRRTLFIWEGVTQYLTAGAVNDTLEFVSSVSGVGSAIEFTYVRRGIIDGTSRPEWFKGFSSFAARVGSPLKFGLDPVELEGYLADRGLKLISDVGAADYQDLYLEPLGRELNVFDAERVAFARVNGSRRD